MHVFVYGTLRRGGTMHALLGERARFEAPARLRGTLYHLGDFPGLVRDSPGVVAGEVFELSGEPARQKETLQVLDAYEGQHFVREQGAVRTPSGVMTVWFWTWTKTRALPRILSGDWMQREGVPDTPAASPARAADPGIDGAGVDEPG